MDVLINLLEIILICLNIEIFLFCLETLAQYFKVRNSIFVNFLRMTFINDSSVKNKRGRCGGAGMYDAGAK